MWCGVVWCGVVCVYVCVCARACVVMVVVVVVVVVCVCMCSGGGGAVVRERERVLKGKHEVTPCMLPQGPFYDAQDASKNLEKAEEYDSVKS